MKHWTIVVGFGTVLFAGCQESPRQLRLRGGEPCLTASECHSGYCALAARPESEGDSICCAVRCPASTGCSPSGGSCASVRSGPDVGAVRLPLGDACVVDDDCLSLHCDEDAVGGLRCCQEDCSSRNEICAVDGRCVPESSLPTPQGPEGLDDADAAPGDEMLGKPLDTSEDAGEPCSSCESPISNAVCGNQVVDDGEECDGQLTCTHECLTIECGDGRVDAGEECDPPNGDDCSASCQKLVCGNDRLDAGEECEPPLAGSCNAECLIRECGNARLDDGEECDPPDAGSCDERCQEIRCGNERVDTGEGCDPPSAGVCSDDCRALGCGNGVRDPGEECDPPETGRCDGNCQLIACGNGRLDTGEECEPLLDERCGSQCQLEVCGNDRQDPGEECEPPGQGSCSDQCLSIACGNGRRDSGEACDAGKQGDDSCTEFCTVREDGPVQYLYTFDDESEGWSIRLTSPDSIGPATTLQHTSSDGDPGPGCLELRGGFTGQQQKVEIDVHENPVLNLEGRVLVARVRWVSGFVGGGPPGAVKMFAKSGPDYTYVSGAWVQLKAGDDWLEISLDPAAPELKTGAFVMDDVREIGFEFATFSGAEEVGAATLRVDSVGLLDEQ